MIYNSTVTGVNESDIMELLEYAEDRFENETMAEATAIVVGEQETNWTRFMQGVGLSELASIMEGEEVIYEGARFDKFIAKAKGFFQMILNKLAELTKRFIARIDQIFKTNDAFVKKYRSTLEKIDYGKLKLTYNGYEFQHAESHPDYKGLRTGKIETVKNNAAEIISKKDEYSREAAEDVFFGGKGKAPSGSTFGEKLNTWYYGDGKKTIDIDVTEVKKQLDFIAKTKENKEKAKKSYKEAAKEVKNIIRELKNAEKKFDDKVAEGEKSSANSTTVSQAFSILLNYWKAFGTASTQAHGAYMTMLGKRNRQARAICAKALNAGGKSKGKEDREKIKAKMEGFVDTSDFLAAVDFI